jgi:hypothetical protein
MEKEITVPPFGRLRVHTQYILPALATAAVFGAWAFARWSYATPPVDINAVTIAQRNMTEPGKFITLGLTKDVTWHRMCRGVTVQELLPTIAAEFPKAISTAPVALGDHKIEVPPSPRRYFGTRDIVISSGLVSTGRWRYRMCIRSECWPWDHWWPIDSGCAEAYVDIK